MEGIFKDFKFLGSAEYGWIFRCSFEIGLNPYEMVEHIDEVREFLAGICRKFNMLTATVTLDIGQQEFATREKLKTEGQSIWRYIAVCND